MIPCRFKMTLSRLVVSFYFFLNYIFPYSESRRSRPTGSGYKTWGKRKRGHIISQPPKKAHLTRRIIIIINKCGTRSLFCWCRISYVHFWRLAIHLKINKAAQQLQTEEQAPVYPRFWVWYAMEGITSYNESTWQPVNGLSLCSHAVRSVASRRNRGGFQSPTKTWARMKRRQTKNVRCCPPFFYAVHWDLIYTGREK